MAEPTADELLLAAVRNYIDVTWTDTALDTKLTGIIKRGQSFLDGISGKENDYSIEGQARSLLFDYVRYFRANAGDQFKINYKDELVALRLGEGVTQYETDNPVVQ